MKIGKYIHDLLLENETVIIPGFGAFISKYKPAEINDDSNEIKPPSKEVSFNQQIRNNDGILVGYIADTEEISHFDALKSIEKERENILYLLDKGEKVELENTGILFYDENNKIGFEASEKENLLLDSFGLEPTSLAEPEEFSEPDMPAHAETSTPVEGKETIIEESGNQEINNNLEEQAGEPKSVIIPETEDETAPVINKESERETNPVISTIDTKPEPEVVATTIEGEKTDQPEERKKRSWLWYLLIIIPIIIAGIIIIKNKGNIDPANPVIQQEKPMEIISEKEEIKALPPDSLTNDSIQNADIDTVKKIAPAREEEIKIDPESPVYYLVGGSFKEEKNAHKYFEQLKAEGYEPFHLGKRGNFFIVGIGKYTSGSEAVRAKKEYMSNNPGTEIWIKKE